MSTISESFSGHRVLVTGACGGIGSAIVRAFARAGATLAICDVNETSLALLTEELRKDARITAAAIDVTDATQVETFCHTVETDLGGLDVLVNTVGVVDNMGTVESLATSVWDRSIAINLTSAFLMAKHCVPMLKREADSVIVNLSSISGMANQAEAMVYSVTKAALISLTRSEAIDLAQHGIRAVAICPGSVSTTLVDRAIELTAASTGREPSEQRRIWESQYPTGRFTTPEEVADLTLFLCSDRARNITGSAVVIDGGITAVLPER
jgi:NAD(P)-dependent dehydrogenase (short-subunit alcohol dehydrogenase family)